MKYLVVSFALLLSIVLAGCAPVKISNFTSQNQTFVSVDVEFNPNAVVPGKPNELQIDSSNQNCPATSASPGCVRFLKNTFGTISFRLKGQGGPGMRACGDPGVNWVITGIAGSVTPDPSDPTKGSSWGAALPSWVTVAFYPITNAASGVLYNGSIDASKTAVTLLNLNNNPASAGVKTLYYRVTASRCNASATKTSDPGLENEGLLH